MPGNYKSSCATGVVRNRTCYRCIYLLNAVAEQRQKCAVVYRRNRVNDGGITYICYSGSFETAPGRDIGTYDILPATIEVIFNVVADIGLRVIEVRFPECPR